MPFDSVPNFEHFGNYILLKKIATGGMAEVFLARPASHRGNGRVQVIKRILPHAANDGEFIKMFNTEIQVCMGFNHPHTVQIHDFGECNRRPYISMEYIEGKNLKDVICKFTERGEFMPIPMALSLLAQAASGLSYAHTFVNKVTGEEVRAIHRDISPHNLIVSYEGNLKVIDFGIAKAASRMVEATQAGTIKGKFAYLSPEQITGETLDARVDIFALGIVAWELLTLRRPFFRAGDSEMTILDTIRNCDFNVKAPSYFNGEVPPELDAVILKALRRNPDERYATAEEFQAALRRVMWVHYPHYSYSENAKTMQALFESEIAQERNEVRLLNMNVQLSLSNSTMTINNDGTDSTIVLPDTAAAAQQATAQAAQQRQLGAEMDQRLRGIEKMMKEKASMRHYVLFAFYLISVVVLKLDESYGFFDFLVPQGRVVAAAPRVEASEEARVLPTAVKRAPARTARPQAQARQYQQQYQPQQQQAVRARQPQQVQQQQQYQYQQQQYQQQQQQAERQPAKKAAARRAVVTTQEHD
ncbi:serine/threonine protein kinase [Bdellovibrio sp. HCB337]|uniref:serine/threonine protein kinase n=1 Tax=Bdellovibrio sp. HCB337 TaxID=3394358 RepID=UPI0039A6FDE8